MPHPNTFSVPPIGAFVRRWMQGGTVSVDPFARSARSATYTNDINPDCDAEWHLEARDFLRMLVMAGCKADRIIFDPPYSPTQIKRAYDNAGLKVNFTTTQTAVLKMDCRNLFRRMATPGCVILSFGWNTVGMGPHWTTEEILLVSHGGDHYDTICMAQRYTPNLIDYSVRTAAGTFAQSLLPSQNLIPLVLQMAAKKTARLCPWVSKSELALHIAAGRLAKELNGANGRTRTRTTFVTTV